jgi:hypothetical protein
MFGKFQPVKTFFGLTTLNMLILFEEDSNMGTWTRLVIESDIIVHSSSKVLQERFKLCINV